MLVERLSSPLASPFTYLRGSVKFAAFFLIVMLYILHHEIAGLLIRDENKRYRYFLRSVQLTTRLGLKLLNVKVAYHKISTTRKSGLIVSNHLSYLDILVLFSEYPALFITSKEISEVFLLGHLTKLAGCFHIERRKEKRTRELLFTELEDMKQKLTAGFDLFLFPEGTSSNGKTVLPFKAHFFQTALDLNLSVTPICLTYDWGNSNPDEICWYGDMAFPAHLFAVCCRKEVRASVTEIAFELTPDMDRYQVASVLQEKIKDLYERH